MKNLLLALAVLLAFAVAYLLLWPVPIDPAAWTPPPAPALEGPYAENERLRGIERLAEGLGTGPEGVALDAQGRLYAGYLDGRVYRFAPDGTNPELLADTGGRPLGTHAMPDGRLIVADGAKGLLAVGADGAVTVLSTQADGVPFRFADDVDSASDGVLYFTDASHRFGFHQFRDDLLEHRPNGRFLAYDPVTGRTTTLVDGLYFPNGVAVGPDDAYVLVNETGKYRILRHWLKGPDAGKTEVFADNLPGIPDNVSFNGRDRFWCALATPRVPDMDWLLPRPFLRKVVFRLPEALQPQPLRHSFVLGFDGDGKVVANLQYAGPDAFAQITSVEEHGDWLYFGSLAESAIGRIALPGAPGG